MSYSLSFNYAAIVLYMAVLFVHLQKKNAPLLRNKVFTYIGIAGLIAVISGTLDVYVMEYVSNPSRAFLEVNSYLYFITLNAVPFIYALYSVSLVENKLNYLSLKLRVLLFGPYVALLIIVFSNLFNNEIFQYLEDGSYIRGNLQVLLYIISFYYTLFGAIYATIYKEVTSAELKVALYVFCFIGIGTAAIQMFFPDIVVQHFGIALCMTLVMLTIQKPEEFLVPELKIYNRTTFEKIFYVNAKSNRECEYLTVYIEDMKLMSQTVGLEGLNTILKAVAAYLESIAPRSVFYLDDMTFVIAKTKASKEEVRDLLEQINRRFEDKWVGGESSLYMTMRALHLRVPVEVSDLNTYYTCNNYLKEMKNPTSWVIGAKDIDLQSEQRKVEVEAAIKRAIEFDYFEMYYQPIYSCEKDCINSAEALLRLRDPEMGFISPAEFIPIAERNGTILKIGEIVFDKVFRFMTEHDLIKKGINYIEVNLSVVQCMQEDLADHLMELMRDYGVPTGRINLEITETAAANSPKMLIKNMHRLFEQGIAFSLDDFGTGYANINSLVDLPLDMIKFDKSLVDMATTHDKGEIILASTVAMVKKMDMRIVAEGIEEREQVLMMRELGIEYLQGFYFSKPLPSAYFLNFLEEFEGFK